MDKRELDHEEREHDRVLFDVFEQHCPSRLILEHVTGRWGILAMVALLDGPNRFSALRRRVAGISEKMLSRTLHDLHRDGLVYREARQMLPPHVEYSLTDAGRRIAVKLMELIELVEAEMPAVLDAHAAEA